MGKMTDALRKARQLKEEKQRGRADVAADVEGRSVSTAAARTEADVVEASPTETPAGPTVVPEPSRPAAPAPEEKAPPAPVLRPAEPQVEPSPSRPEEAETVLAVPPAEEPTPRVPGRRKAAPAVSVVLPDVEPRGEPPTVTVPRHQAVLPEVEPSPLDKDTPYLVVHSHKDGRTADEFRTLKNQLTSGGSPARVILVTSCVAGEGKTTVAANLAVSFANTYGEKVVLVDGNIVRPKIGELLKLPEDGLVQVVRGHLHPEDCAVKTEIPGLWALSAGINDGRREGLLDSKPVAELLTRLRKRFTRVVMELPPLRDTGEGLSLFPLADVVLIPVMKSRTRRGRLRRFLAKAANHGAGRLHCVFIQA